MEPCYTLKLDAAWRPIEIIDGLKMLPELIREVLELDSKVKEIAEDLCDKKSLLLIGRGYSFATCLEGMFVIIVLSGFPYSRLVTKIRNYKTLSATQSTYIDYRVVQIMYCPLKLKN